MGRRESVLKQSAILKFAEPKTLLLLFIVCDEFEPVCDLVFCERPLSVH